MNNDIFDKIKYFTIKIRGNYKNALTRETLLEQELKITGDDAIEFLEAFSKEFDVNINNFEFNKYFGSEGESLLTALNHLSTRTGSKSRGKLDLTLGDLEQAVKIKCL